MSKIEKKLVISILWHGISNGGWKEKKLKFKAYNLHQHIS